MGYEEVDWSPEQQGIRAEVAEHRRKRAVTLSVRADNGRGNDFTAFDLVNLERFRATEVLEDLFVFISNCNFHRNLLIRRHPTAYCNVIK